jgi:ribosomal 30S subunit maturation factor RimM
MEISDLIAIGKLGNSVDSDGYISFKPNKIFQSFSLQYVFLLFTDHSVRYVKIEDNLNDKMLKIDDLEITRAAAEDGKALVMLAQEDITMLLDEHNIQDYAGMKVHFADSIIGQVKETFFNNAQDILVVELINGNEIMIPVVDHYVEQIEGNVIYTKNIEGLMNL